MDSFGRALEIITRYNLGGTSVVDESGRLSGILTDGDIRRILLQFASQGGSVGAAMDVPILGLMTRQPMCIRSDTLAYDALQMMENHQPRPVLILPVVDSETRPVGMLHIHTLVQAGFNTSLPYEQDAAGAD
jgi:arabinose-5-phosphate isomerase